MSIWEFLGLDKKKVSTGDTETVRRIVEGLDRLEPARARYIAAFAFLLSRVARADLNISDEETSAMEQIVMEHGGLPEEQAIIVVQMAKTQNLLFGATEDYLVSKEFGRIATREEKTALLHCLFAVSASDESVSSAEDQTIRQIGDELGLEHADFIAIRSNYREHLAVLKKPPNPQS